MLLTQTWRESHDDDQDLTTHIDPPAVIGESQNNIKGLAFRIQSMAGMPAILWEGNVKCRRKKTGAV